jgi:DNA uptake protein ComE-like DNA-binding protein
MENSKKFKNSGLSESFVIGTVALVFLVIGYQTALFIHQAAVMRIVANRDEPDTVLVYVPDSVEDLVRKNSAHSPRSETVRKNVPRKKVETFRFDPNTVPVEDLCRLGFSPKQAQSIDNYRRKGGRFRRKSDFAKSYVVSDSIYRRLEPYIDIPLVDLNLADSAAFDALPGIGGWFAAKMIEHREALKGYSYKEQLMDIYRFDQEKFDDLKDLVTVSQEHVSPYPLWTLPADSLRRHPYINNLETAKAIVLFRENTPSGRWTVKGLHDAGILTDMQYDALSRCIISVQ